MSRVSYIKDVLKEHNIENLDVTVLASVEFALETLGVSLDRLMADLVLAKTKELYLKDEASINIDYIAMVAAVAIKNNIHYSNKWELLKAASKCETIQWTNEGSVIELIERCTK